MAPKRKAGELERPPDGLQHTSKGDANEDNNAAGEHVVSACWRLKEQDRSHQDIAQSGK